MPPDAELAVFLIILICLIPVVITIEAFIVCPFLGIVLLLILGWLSYCFWYNCIREDKKEPTDESQQA